MLPVTRKDQKMNFKNYSRAVVCAGLIIAAIADPQSIVAQTNGAPNDLIGDRPPTTEVTDPPRLIQSVYPTYYSQTDGLSLDEIVAKAFESNEEIKIARLEIEKARARFTQARKLPNPVVELEQTSDRLVGGGGEGSFSAGVGMPVDVFGQRRRKAALAEAEITLREAEVEAREREVAAQVFESYVEALAALRELKVLEDLLDLDMQTTRFVQIRVNEGESPPLELNLLQAEVERLRARGSLVEGKLLAAYSRLRFFAGIQPDIPLKLREEISSARIPKLPSSMELGLALAIKSRPEIRLALLEEELANAGLRLARAQGKADFSAYTRYTQGRSSFDDPRGPFSQRDRNLTFGLTITVPVFNRNEGARAEAELAIRQAQERKTFYERIVRSEVMAAFQRLEASRRALSTLEVAVIPRSRQNVETIRQIYEIGELRITDLIAEQRRLLEANQDLTDTLTEKYRAQADLFIAIGLKFED